MNTTRSGEQKPLRSPAIEALRTLFFTAFLLLIGGEIATALISGRAIFPMRWNDIYVTIAEQPGWFSASVVAWLLMFGLLAYVSLQCWRRFLRALRST
jgi:hypothetical protein